MGWTRRTFACRISAVLVLGLLWLCAGSAHAGTYEVLACDVAPDGVNRSWTASASDRMWTGENCPSAGRAAGGLFAGSGVNVGTIPAFATSAYTFDAPAGTSIQYLSARYWFHRVDPYWRVGVFADGAMLHGCEPAARETGCGFSSESIGVPSEWGWAQGVQHVAIQTTCGAAGGCRSDTTSPTGDRAGVRLYSASVRVFDASAPSVWDVGDGPLTNGAWQRGGQYVGYAATDNVGIRRTRLYVDGRQLRDDARDCDFTRRVPCSDVTYSRYGVETGALSDGDHTVRVEVVDTAGNANSYSTPFKSDNTPPDAPAGVEVEGGSAWRHTNQFHVTWRNPASASPIWIAHYQLCNTATNACTGGGRAGMGIDSISDLSVPAPGEYTLRLTLQDYAGNVNAANQSAPVVLRFDDVPPGRAEPVKRNGWLNGREAKTFDQLIRLEAGEFRPVSEVAGYSVTTDGTDPDASIDSVGQLYRVVELPEGLTTIKARAISGSGVASLKVGSTVIAVDRTDPTVTEHGASAPGTWSREPLAIHIAGADQPGLSGMEAAPADAPVEEGGFVAYRLDGSSPARIRGATADLTVSEDGNHTLTYSATDAAGNESPEQVAHIRVDRTPPELVVFDDPQPADPRRIVVATSDRTSGVAAGRIEMRPVAGGEWRPLETTRDGNRFLATIDDEAVPRGVYELRAHAFDAAGNESIGDRRRDGSVARIDTATIRAETSLRVAFATPASSKKCTRKRGKKQCTTKNTAPAGKTLTIAYNKAALVRGTLTTGVAPIADGVVDVYARAKATGSEFAPIGAIRTNAQGSFTFKAPAGAGRVLSFRYAGSPTLRGSSDEATLGVAASATLRASRRRARNGEAVTFSGVLRTRPLSGRPKSLNLQAYYRRRWRTFATPRVSNKGRWTYRYRFGATHGYVRYRFRVVVPPSADYPYDKGTSKPVTVSVAG